MSCCLLLWSTPFLCAAEPASRGFATARSNSAGIAESIDADVPVVGAPEESEEQPIALNGGPLYWDLRLRLMLGPWEEAKRARLFLPLADGRQAIVRRVMQYAPLQYRETVVGENLEGEWRATARSRQQHEVVVDLTLHIDGERAGATAPVDPADRARWLQPELRIPGNNPQLQAQARALQIPGADARTQAKALHDFVFGAIERIPQSAEPLGAVEVLQRKQGDAAGKARLLTALLRAHEIPARVVGGLILKDLKQRRRYTYWVEAAVAVGDGAREIWIPIDPARGYFERLPNRFVTLFRGDQALIRHTARLPFAYEFVIRQATRESVELALQAAEPTTEPGWSRRGVEIASNQKTLTQPVAAIVWITDRAVPPGLAERLTAQAADERVRLTILGAPYASLLFRGKFIEEVIKSHDRLVREADAVILHTQDEAGLYALMGQGGRAGSFARQSIITTGAMSSGVTAFLGTAAASLLHPKELIVIPAPVELSTLWDLVGDFFLNGYALEEVAAKAQLPVRIFADRGAPPPGRWRPFLIRTWVRAAEAGVTPQGIAVVLLLPVIALLVVVCRGVIGLETFGTFAPVIICVAFLHTGLLWGVFLFAAILGLGVLLRAALGSLYLFLVARMALLIACVSLIMLGAVLMGIWWGWGPLVETSIFPMVIMAGMIEHFTRAQMESGLKTALWLSLTTLGLCVAGYLLTDWGNLQSHLLVYPEWLLGVMAVTFAIGRWRGLRLTEYRRFSALSGERG